MLRYAISEVHLAIVLRIAHLSNPHQQVHLPVTRSTTFGAHISLVNTSFSTNLTEAPELTLGNPTEGIRNFRSKDGFHDARLIDIELRPQSPTGRDGYDFSQSFMLFTRITGGVTQIYGYNANDGEWEELEYRSDFAGIMRRAFEWNRDYMELHTAIDFVAERNHGERREYNMISISKRRRRLWSLLLARIDQPYFWLRDDDSSDNWVVGAVCFKEKYRGQW